MAAAYQSAQKKKKRSEADTLSVSGGHGVNVNSAMTRIAQRNNARSRSRILCAYGGSSIAEA